MLGRTLTCRAGRRSYDRVVAACMLGGAAARRVAAARRRRRRRTGAGALALMPDLFGTPSVPGLSVRDAFLDAGEEAALIAQIDADSLVPFRFHQWTGKRLTRSYGWSYDFETGRFAATDPIPEWLGAIKRRAADFAKLAIEDLSQALLIRYDAGAAIGWHKDRPVFEDVIGISLGYPATLGLRRRVPGDFARDKIDLAPRSAYLLSGAVRHEWEHSIAAMAKPRWSITFRSLSARGKET